MGTNAQNLKRDLQLSPELSLLWRDVLAVAVFVIIGRRNHDEGTELAGIIKTAAPFLIALPFGWLFSGALREPYAGKSGLGTWLITLIGGIVLRKAVFGGGTAIPFVMVATLFLFVTMVLWRFFIWRKRRPTQEV